MIKQPTPSYLNELEAITLRAQARNQETANSSKPIHGVNRPCSEVLWLINVIRALQAQQENT